eukprot:Opistho-2@70175
MLESEVLVLKLFAIDRLATSTVVLCEVTPLAHKLRNDPVEGGALVPIAFFVCAQLSKVLGGFRNNVPSQLHDHPSCSLPSNGDVEIYSAVGFCAFGGASTVVCSRCLCRSAIRGSGGHLGIALSLTSLRLHGVPICCF